MAVASGKFAAIPSGAVQNVAAVIRAATVPATGPQARIGSPYHPQRPHGPL